MAAPVDQEGILNQAVLQPCSNYGTYGNEGAETIEEVWKVRTSECINVENGFKVFGTTFRIGYELPGLSGSQWQRHYDRPSIPSNWFWMCSNIRVEELSPAGDHCYLRITATAKNNELYPKDSSGVGSGRLDPKHSQWSIEWGTRQATALIYLVEKSGTCNWIKHIDESKGGNSPDLNVNDMSLYAKLAADCMRQYSASAKIGLEKYQFIYYGEVYELPENAAGNSKPRDVVDKYLAGVMPLMHFPIIKRVSTANFKRSTWTSNPPKWSSATGASNITGIGEKLDEITTPPWNLLPFDFHDLNKWKWIKTGDSFQTIGVNNSTLTYTRTEIWQGDLFWEPKFYGDNHWTIGSSNS